MEKQPLDVVPYTSAAGGNSRVAFIYVNYPPIRQVLVRTASGRVEPGRVREPDGVIERIGISIPPLRLRDAVENGIDGREPSCSILKLARMKIRLLGLAVRSLAREMLWRDAPRG